MTMQIDKLCPWCDGIHPAKIARVDDARGCREWQCGGCGKRWTTKDAHPRDVFPFWPGDIDAIFVGADTEFEDLLA